MVRTAEVALFVVRRRLEQVLVLHRVSGLGGFWHVVAGGVEAAESWEDAATRELYEETGFSPNKPLGSCPRSSFSYSVKPSRSVDAGSGIVRSGLVRVDCVVVEVEDDAEPTLNSEHDSYRWCSLQEAMRLLRWPTVRDAMRVLVAPDQAAAVAAPAS
jgi:8-oxo-dGTP pyrophosphatase MutT (NUDIX family)